MAPLAKIHALIKTQNQCVQQINPCVRLNDTYIAEGLLKLPQIIKLEKLKLGFKLCHDLLLFLHMSC